jgi:hypothetical protein
MATLGSLVVQLGADVGKLQSDMNKAVGVVDRASAGIRRAATVAATALGAIGAGLTLSTITGAARQIIDLGDKLRDLSFATGQSVEQLSFLEFAAGQSGTSIDAISTAAARLSKNLVEVASGRGEQAAEALRTLGLAADDLSRLDLATQIGKIGTQLAAIDNPAQRAATGAALFGKQFKELAPFILEGEEGVGRLIDRFIELNGVITRDQADKFDAFNDSLGELQLASRAAGKAIADELAPPLTALFSSIATAIPRIGPALSGLGEDFDTFLTETALKLERFNVRFETFKAELFNSDRFRAQADEAAETVAALEQKLRVRRNAGRTGREETDVSARRAAVLNPAFGSAGIEVDPEAAAKAAARASKEAQRAADALQRESDSVRAFLQDYSREREQDFQREVELSRSRIDSLRQSIATPRERAIAELAEFERVFGSESEEYGRKAVEVFTELEDTVSTLDESGQRAAKTFADLGATFSSAFEEAIFSASSFSDVLAGLGQDIARLLLRQTVTDPISGFLQKSLAPGGGGLGGIFDSLLKFGGFRASGGPVSAGRAYVVGERGPELLIPGTAGTVVPNGTGGSTVNVYNYGNEPVRTEDNGTRGIDVFVGSSVSRAASRGMLTPLGVRPPLVAR